ncbi:sporulation-specific protein 22 [Ceratocystis pirilliformis]|uniref:Sporulation-specific protein 22 n=1 Tax=Ceratocystis pirilliformis TaxID=259994 RepID=A0ABR3YX28_9PEZI
MNKPSDGELVPTCFGPPSTAAHTIPHVTGAPPYSSLTSTPIATDKPAGPSNGTGANADLAAPSDVSTQAHAPLAASNPVDQMDVSEQGTAPITTTMTATPVVTAAPAPKAILPASAPAIAPAPVARSAPACVSTSVPVSTPLAAPVLAPYAPSSTATPATTHTPIKPHPQSQQAAASVATIPNPNLVHTYAAGGNDAGTTTAGSTTSAASAVTTVAVSAQASHGRQKEKDRKEHAPPQGVEPAPKKRRKVNHACIYCRRSERPCTRCIKRNIGHLCHDEKREPDSKKVKNAAASTVAASSAASALTNTQKQRQVQQQQQQQQQQQLLQQRQAQVSALDVSASVTAAAVAAAAAASNFGLGQEDMLHLVPPVTVAELQAQAGGLNSGSINPFTSISELFMGHNHFHDIPNIHSSYMAASEVNNEFQLLNDFLHTSMLDDGLGLSNDESTADPAATYSNNSRPEILNGFASLNGSNPLAGNANPHNSAAGGPPVRVDGLSVAAIGSMLPPPDPKIPTSIAPDTLNASPTTAPATVVTTIAPSSTIAAPGTLPVLNVPPRDRDKARRDYYLQAADPTGNDNPEERMQLVLKAKYEAGLLKPFNYIKGYQKLSTYLDSHIALTSKQKILKCLNRFRPKFREIAQALTDMELVVVEMWFEKQLLEYDRVFASMAVPACLWRRTGEIFRGNKEMAELLHVPVEELRDGSIALHQIITEESMVRYWEEFETIAFDPDHDTLLTACSLKSPDDSTNVTVNCAFSFMIHRDDYKIRDKGFCDTICKTITTSVDNPSIKSLSSDISSHARTADKLCQKRLLVYARELNELDRSATSLWNLTCRLLRKKDESLGVEQANYIYPRRQLFVKATTFAFQLLDLTRWQGGTEALKSVVTETQLGIYRISLSAARACLDESELDSCLVVLKRSVEFSEGLARKEELTDEQKLILSKYDAEYFVLRTSLGRLDVANHMYDKSKTLFQSLDSVYSENLAEVILDIGKGLMRKKDYKLGVTWLKRAYEIITLHHIDKLSRLGIEQRLTIMQALVRGHLLEETPEGREHANELICQLESEIGQLPAVLLLRIHALKAAPQEEFDSEAFASTLERFSRTPGLSESQFKTVLHEAKMLKERSPFKALSVARTLLCDVAIGSGNHDWISKSLIIVVWMYAALDEPDTDHSLSITINNVHQAIQAPVDSMTAGAIQSVLWKRIEASVTKARLSDAETWCQAALHPLFENGGVANQGKLGRKLIFCALEKSDFEKAKEVFHDLPESTQKEQATAFLMFKVATRSKDSDFAAACLRNITHATKASKDILYACVIDSQYAGNLDTAIIAMKNLMEVTEAVPDSNMHVPSLMRCTIRLLYQKLDRGVMNELEDIATDLCNVFEAALRAIEKLPKNAKGGKLFPTQELDWFNQNSYNTALKHVDTWPPMLVCRLMKVCLAITEFYPEDISISASHDLSLKRLCGNFVISAALAALARSEENVKERHQAYLELRKHVTAYDEEFEARKDTYEPYIQKDLMAKLSVLYVFDFEAAAAQKEWDDMRTIVGKSVATCPSAEMLKGMGDYMLSLIDIPPRAELYRILQLIINEIWKLEQFDSAKLAKYMRCLFQVVLPYSEDLALQTLNNVLTIAKEGPAKSTIFPPDELEWITIMAFNHATDLWSSGNDEAAKTWFEKALSLGHYREDDGVFEAHLQERFMKLQWN